MSAQSPDDRYPPDPELAEAMQIIEDYPEQEDYVDCNLRQFADAYGEYTDNGWVLASYWRSCKSVVDSYNRKNKVV